MAASWMVHHLVARRGSIRFRTEFDLAHYGRSHNREASLECHILLSILSRGGEKRKARFARLGCDRRKPSDIRCLLGILSSHGIGLDNNVNPEAGWLLSSMGV